MASSSGSRCSLLKARNTECMKNSLGSIFIRISHLFRFIYKSPGQQLYNTSALPSPTSLATVCVGPCRVATPPVLQESPPLLVLVDVDVAVRVHPDGMAAIALSGACRARPAGQDLPIES